MLLTVGQSFLHDSVRGMTGQIADHTGMNVLDQRHPTPGRTRCVDEVPDSRDASPTSILAAGVGPAENADDAFELVQGLVSRGPNQRRRVRDLLRPVIAADL